MSLYNWLRAAYIEDDVRLGLSAEEAAGSRLVKRRNQVLEQENEILRRAAAFLTKDIFENDVPTGP